MNGRLHQEFINLFKIENPKSILSTHSMKTRMKWEQDQTLQEEGQGKDGRGEVQVQEDGQGDMGVAQLCSLIC